MKWKKIVLFSAFFVILTHVYGQNNQPMIGKDAPDFSLKDLNGGMVKLSELQGKFVVIHFAASW
jgi:peroxiredoxin